MFATSAASLISLPLIASPLVYLAGHLPRRVRWISPRWAALAAFVVMWIAYAAVLVDLRAQGTLILSVEAVFLRVDGISLLVSGLALVLGTAVVLFSGPYVAGDMGEEKYYAMIMAMIGAIIGLVCAQDLFNLWIWFETMAISSYLLVAFHREQLGSLEAGVKYLVQSACGSALVLLGVALVLAQTGTLSLDDIRTFGAQSSVIAAAGVLFIVGFGVKIALVPLHTWLPDAHAQAPSGVSALLSGVVIEAGLIALLRALGPLTAISWGGWLVIFALVNIFIGNLLALRQREVKRLLAFSSVSQIGYMLLGLGIALQTGQPEGAQAGLLHLLTHGVMKGLAFLAVGALFYALHASKGDHRPLMIDDLQGAARRYPVTAAALTIALIGLAGVPPTAGFVSKFQVLAAGIAAGDTVLLLATAFAALNSLLSIAYYIPMAIMLYRHDSGPQVEAGGAVPRAMTAPMMVLAVSIFVIGVAPGLLQSVTALAGADVVAWVR